MKIYVLGYKGMLGRYVYSYLKTMKHNVIGLSREDIDITKYISDNQLLSDDLAFSGIEANDVIINCIGAIKPMVDKLGTLNAIKINSFFPHILSNICEKSNYHLIHITTDCVYDCKPGVKDEKTLHNCTDVYGKTKSLGEPENCTVVRTSIIGEEINQSRSLIEWVKSMKNKEASGYVNHTWNGVTCLQVAKIFDQIIKEKNYWKGVRHIFSPNVMTKYDLVQTISDVYDLNISVSQAFTQDSCERELSSIYSNNFQIPDIKTQIIELLNYRKNFRFYLDY